MKKEIKFINFPIELMQGVFNGDKTIEQFTYEVMAYGTYKNSLMIFNDEKFFHDDVTAFKISIDFFKFNILHSQKNLLEFQEVFAKYENSKIMTGLNLDVLKAFNEIYKDEYEIQTLIVFLALKSIIGKGFISKTTDDFLKSRIAGIENVKNYADQLPNLTPYLMRKIKSELLTNWNVLFAQSKGFYFSIDVDSKKFFAEVEAKKNKSRIKFEKIKRDENEAKLRAKI